MSIQTCKRKRRQAQNRAMSKEARKLQRMARIKRGGKGEIK